MYTWRRDTPIGDGGVATTASVKCGIGEREKNDRERVRAKCKEQECKWEIFCSWNKGEKCFQVKTFNSEHSCARVFKNKTAKKKWISKKLEAKIRQHLSYFSPYY